MNVNDPVQEPVTGRGDLGELAEPIQALSQFYRAFNTRDLAMMRANWDDSPEASMDNPLGGIRRGWIEIEQVYVRIFSGQATVRVEFHDYTLHRAADAFWVVGRERGTLQAKGRSLDLAIRTSRISRERDGGWKQAHHHGSIEDAELLAAYQELVR